MIRPQRVIASLMAACIALAGSVQSAQAALIGTEQVAATRGQGGAGSPQARLQAALARADVAQALAERGVDVEQARARVAALTDAEAARLAEEIDRAPAGAGELVGTLVLVFVILVFSDILGYTHIFPFIHPAK